MENRNNNDFQTLSTDQNQTLLNVINDTVTLENINKKFATIDFKLDAIYRLLLNNRHVPESSITSFTPLKDIIEVEEFDKKLNLDHNYYIDIVSRRL
jgi:hypothetical protein